MRAFAPVLFAAALLLAGCGPESSKTTPSTAAASKATTSEKPGFGGCHPGCFPAGTLVDTPSGPREVQAIREGEIVTLIDADGRATSGPVVSVFDTCNELVEVRTDGGTLTTTAKQPLCLRSGECKPAGELAAGEVIWQWAIDKRTAATVIAVVSTSRHAPVYNLVVGDGKVFIANGFLARGKPPTAGGVQ
jgi:hypothetical protein